MTLLAWAIQKFTQLHMEKPKIMKFVLKAPTNVRHNTYLNQQK